MRRFAALMVLWSSMAQAETPRGTYTLDRGGAKPATNAEGAPHPSCGGQKLYGGQATFVVEYRDRDKIRVNGREWRFRTVAGDPASSDAYVIILDPESKEQIWIWFRSDGTTATGYLSFATRREGKLCVDAWELRGKYER
jgi:hypothetical protein